MIDFFKTIPNKLLLIFITLLLSLILISCFIASFGFSLLFYTNGEIVYENGSIDTTDATATTVILIVMVIAMEGSKIVIGLCKVMFKGKYTVKIANQLLICLFFASIVASMSFFLISNTDYSPGDKIIESLSEYIPMWIFEKHLKLLTNVSISIFIEILILLLPDFIIALYKDMDDSEKVTNFRIFKRIIAIIPFVINKILNKIEKIVGIQDSELNLQKTDEIKVKDFYKLKKVKDKKFRIKLNDLKNPKEVKDNLKTNDNVLKDEEVKDINVKDKNNIPKVSLLKKESPKEVKDNLKTNKNPKEVKDINIKSPKTKNKSPKVVDLKFIEVARYILDEFEDGELIKWDKVKDFSQINDEYSLKKLRKYLKDKDIIRTEGKKSYRNKCPKSVLKNISMS